MIEKNSNKKFQTANVLTLSITHHIHDIYTSFLAPLYSNIHDAFGVQYALFGLLAVFQRIPTLFNPILGILAERIRIRYLVIFSPTATAIFMSLIGNAPSYVMLCILVFMSGLSSMMFHVPTPVLMRQVAGDKTGRGMSFYMLGGELARTIGPLAVVAAVDIWGFGGLFKLIPAGMVASLILFMKFRKFDIRKNFPHNKSEGSYTDVLKRYFPLLALIALFTLSRGFMKSLFSVYFVGYLEDLGYSKIIATASYSTFYLSGAAGVFLSGTISDYLGKRTTLVILSLVAPILLFIYLYGGVSANSFPIVILIGFFILAPTPVFLAIVNRIDSQHVTFLNGIYMTSNFLMSSLATMLTGIGLDHLESQTVFLISGIIAILAIPIVLMLPKK